MTWSLTLIEPLVSHIKEFAEKEGVSFDDVLEMLNEKHKKPKTPKTYVPVKEATAFFFFF